VLDFSATIVRVDSPPLAPLAPGEQAIDIAHLSRMTLGDHALECEVLNLFLRQADMLLARMKGAPPANIAAMAHTLKGSARGIGAWRVAHATEAVELAAKATGNDLNAAVNTLAAMVEEARALIVDALGVD
jgi:HPt (histidine-containing phosphotransfer) domain-containing protein